MPFKRQFEADLVAWDVHAPATVAQIMIMGGVLRPNFDKRAFDRSIGRRPNRPVPNSNDMRLMVKELPTLSLTFVTTVPMADLFDEDRVRQAWLARGSTPLKIDRYLASRSFRGAKQHAAEFAAIGAALGSRYKEVVTPQPKTRLLQALNTGGAVVTTNMEDRSNVLLTASRRSRGKVRAYFPHSGTVLSTIDDLHSQGIINLNYCGGTVHAM